jgi:hypothetical protein
MAKRPMGGPPNSFLFLPRRPGLPSGFYLGSLSIHHTATK